MSTISPRAPRALASANRCGTPLYAGAVVEQLLAWLDEAARRAGVTFQVREFTPVAP
jgi:FMN-dependent NADH-azoreductase